jgi:hypothetical protein
MVAFFYGFHMEKTEKSVENLVLMVMFCALSTLKRKKKKKT